MKIRDLALMSALAIAVVACETSSDTSGDDSMNAGKDAYGFAAGSQEDLTVTAGDRVFYGFDLYNVTPEGQATIAREAEWLAKYPNATVTIAGHCDERGTKEYNLGLGMRRATAHKTGLVGAGVDEGRIALISYGKEDPIVEGSTEEAYAQNRVTIVTLN